MDHPSDLKITVKRAYEAAAASDGCRVLVDRLWPRGVAKEDLAIDAWVKEAAPSTALRKWFGKDPTKWVEFKQRYFVELDDQGEALDAVRAACSGATLTLVFGAKDEAHNNAVALQEYLERHPATHPHTTGKKVRT